MPQSQKQAVPPPSRTEGMLIVPFYPPLKQCWGQLQSQCLFPVCQAYGRLQSQQPCHALGGAVTKVFDSLFWSVVHLIVFMLKTLVTFLDRNVTTASKERALASARKIDCAAVCVRIRIDFMACWKQPWTESPYSCRCWSPSHHWLAFSLGKKRCCTDSIGCFQLSPPSFLNWKALEQSRPFL